MNFCYRTIERGPYLALCGKGLAVSGSQQIACGGDPFLGQAGDASYVVDPNGPRWPGTHSLPIAGLAAGGVLWFSRDADTGWARIPLPSNPGIGFELSGESLKKYSFGGTKPMEFVWHHDGSVEAL